MIKTINLSAGEEVYCDCIGGEHAYITNLSDNTVYASCKSGIVPEGDNVKQIAAGEGAILLDCCKKVYLYAKATAKVQVEGTNYVNANFRKQKKGGGGSEPSDTKWIEDGLSEVIDI